MKILVEKMFAYVLMDSGTDWILTFLIGGVAVTDVSIRLSAEEIAKIQNNATYLDTLVEYIKTHRVKYSQREIIPAVWPTRK